MSNRNEILTELREIAPRLALLEKTNPYKVPEGYFVSFKNTMLQKVGLNEARQELQQIAPALSKLDKQLAESIPADYFSNFSTGLLQKVHAAEVANELAEIAPGLSKLEKANAYTVPAAYFKRFAGTVLKQIQVAEKPQQQPMPGWLVQVELILSRTIGVVFKPRYSAAFAGFATLVVVGMLFFMKVEQCADLDCQLAQLSTEDINAYLETHPDFNSEQIFDGAGTSMSTASFAVYTEAWQDLDKAALDEALME